ncbi:MAG: VCBS repeat-containing protein, partial [Planctomycetes bacterium]|nr:VCBS repeat-containing protein [Planctomycetota bacterium]
MSKARSHRKRRSGVQPVLSARSSGLRQVRLQVEQLEDRTLLSTSDAVALSFIDAALPYQAAHVSEYLAYPGDSVLNRISLNAGDMVTASVNTAPYGGGLNSYLRIFEDIGGGNVREIASNDNFRGLDAGLTFQAPNTGVYYVGVSGFDNTAYDPTVPFSGTGMSSGLFDLNLALQAAVAQPNLVASSFQISQANGVWGDSFTVNYALQNRGALDSVPTTLSLLISASNRFDDGVPELQSVSIPTLAAGNSLSGSFTVTLGAAGTPLPPFSDSQQVFLGLGIGSGSPISPTRGNDWSSLKMLKAETIAPGEVLDTLATAKPIAIDSLTSNISLSPGEQKFFAITLTQSGNLKARLDGASGSASLALYDAQGLPIVQSNGQSPSNPSPLLHHVLIGSPDNGGTVYYLQVKNLGSASSIGTLDVLFTPSASKFFTTQVENGNAALVTGDFNGDAQLDLATTYSYYVNSVQVLLGNNDGTFQEPLAYSTQILAEALITGDFTGDGRLDMIVGTSGTNGAQILVGNGDGSFQNATTISSQGGDSLIAGDFNGDGRLDVAASDSYYETFIVLLGLGDGTFQGVPSIVVPGRPTSLEVGDFNDDGRLDVAIAGEYSNQLTVLLGQGDGTFLNSGTFDLGTSPGTVVAGDFNRDGRLDLAAANITSGDVTALLGQGDGTFAVAGTYAIGDRVYSLETSDLNRDGIVDLAVLASGSDTVTVLLGLGDGSFRNAGSFALGAFPLSIVSGDFNGDGRADLAAANYISNTVQVLLGNGDGTFPQIGSPNKTGQLPWTLASGDFNGDGRLDFASANYNSNDVSILLGQGDGTFLAKDRIAAGTGPYSLAVGDFNGDGRLDLVVGNYGSFDVTLLLGSGDGSFQSADTFDVGGIPSAFSVEDYDKDGNPDLAVAIEYDPNRYDGQQVKILLGDGLGSFHSGNTLTVGARPKSLVTGDFNGDGNLDLASANYNSFDLTVLLGDGLGNFLSTTTISLGGAAVAVTAGDFNGDGRVDLAVGTFYSNGITVLLSNGDGTFQDQGFQSVSASLRTLVAGDFNGDGNLDLARTNYLYPSYAPANSVTIMLGDGSGSFQEFDSFSTTSYPQGLIVGDFNGDGRLDLATANRNTAHVTSALGLGNGSFVSPVLAPIVVRSTPLVVTPPGSQVSDIFVLSETGRILFRRGLPTQTGTYAPPVVLNPDPRFAARDLALVSTAGGNFLLAALHSTPTAMAGGPAISQVTLYVPQADGTFTKMPGLDLPAGVLPASIATADLTGDGLGDLVITAGASDQLFVSLQLAPGVFGPAV